MFLNPWAIIFGVVAAGLPLAVHFLTRPRPIRMPLSTLRFVHEAVLHRRTRHRLRDALVLALRTLAVLLVAFAVARPFLGQAGLSAVEEQADTVRIVVLDVSQSMGAASHGIEAFERARPLAAKQIEYRRGMKADLILAGARPTSIFTRASTNFSVLRDELSGARVQPEKLAVQEALNLASEIIAREVSTSEGQSAGKNDLKGQRPELVIVSDFQRSNWAAADFSVLPAGTRIALESVAPAETPPNLAILRVAAQGRAEIGRDLRLEVEVGNFSDSPQTVTVEVLLGGASVQLSGLCGPNLKTVLTGDLALRDAGWQTGEARLLGVSDALAADNVRACVFDVRPAPRLALVTREPATKRPSASYFLERAMAPVDRTAGDAETELGGSEGVATPAGGLARLDPARLDRDVIGSVDLLIVVQPGRMPEESINQLASVIRRGRGILYIASDAADAANLRLIAGATTGLLKFPAEFAPAAAKQPRRNQFLAEVQKSQPPFQIFGDELPALLETLRFSGGLDSRRVEGALAEDILGQYSDRSVFLASATLDAGGFVVMNADLTLSNLPMSPLYVPLVGELVQKLLGQNRRTGEMACGEPFALMLPPDAAAAADLSIAGPVEGEAIAGDLSDDGAGVLWKGEAAGGPGAYRVLHKTTPVFAVAAAIPAAESDLRSVPAKVFEERLAGGREVRFRSLTGLGAEEHDTVWSWLAVACVVCVLGELTALKGFKT
jgi:hypothetical protein